MFDLCISPDQLAAYCLFPQGSARDLAESQLQELRRAASTVAAIAAARDRLERFVFKVEEKIGQDTATDGAALLETTQKWLAEGTAVGGSDPTSKADYADKLSALELAFPVSADCLIALTQIDG